MRNVLFGGPSLFGIDSTILAGVELRPPAQSGDVLAAVMQGVPVIGLVDGLFGNVSSVWHKEILAALNAGVNVLGAASIGALRAAECHTFGMIGIGRIFEDYRDGRRVSDADVAVLHAPAELHYQPLTVALVDVEITLEALLAKGVVSDDDANEIGSAARRLNFRDRTWEEIFRICALPKGRRAIMQQTIAASHFSQKARDALELIRALRDRSGSERSGSRILSEPFHRTSVFVRLERRVRDAR